MQHIGRGGFVEATCVSFYNDNSRMPAMFFVILLILFLGTNIPKDLLFVICRFCISLVVLININKGHRLNQNINKGHRLNQNRDKVHKLVLTNTIVINETYVASAKSTHYVLHNIICF